MRSDTVLSNDGTTIAYDVAGNDDRPLLLRIDGAATYRRLDPGRAAFTQRLTERFRVVSYDRRGRGASEDQDGYAVDREIEDVAAVLDAFGERGFVVGLSSGAALALRCAAAGLGIDALACYEPPFVVSQDRPPVTPDYAMRLQEEVTAGRPGEAVKLFMTEAVGMPVAMVEGMAGQPFWSLLEQLAQTLVYDAHVMGDTMQGRPEAISAFSSVELPTLVMHGSASEPWLRSAASGLAETLRNGTLEELPGQTHDVDPVILADSIGSYFSSLRTNSEGHV